MFGHQQLLDVRQTPFQSSATASLGTRQLLVQLVLPCSRANFCYLCFIDSLHIGGML